MATKFYLHATIAGSYHRAGGFYVPAEGFFTLLGYGEDSVGDPNYLSYRMDAVKGTSQNYRVVSVNGVSCFTRFVSGALRGGQTISGTAALVAAAATDGVADYYFIAVLNGRSGMRTLWDGTGTSDHRPPSDSTERAFTGTARSLTSTTVEEGDVLTVELWARTTGAANAYLYINGTTEGSDSDNAAYMLFSNDIVLSSGSTMFLHTATTGVSGTLPTAGASISASTPDAIISGTNRSMDMATGLSQTNVDITRAGSPVKGSLGHRFCSEPLKGQTIDGFVRLHGASDMSVAGTPTAAYVRLVLGLWRPSTGALVGLLFDGPTAGLNEWDAKPDGVDYESEHQGVTRALTSRTAEDGDIIVAELWGYTYGGSGGSVRFFYDGTTAEDSASCAAYLHFSKILAFNNVTKLYLHDAAVDLAGTLPSSKISAQTLAGSALTGWDTLKTLSPVKGSNEARSVATKKAVGWVGHRRFCSDPLPAQTISGTVALSGSLMDMYGFWESYVTFALGLWRPSTGSLVGMLVDGPNDSLDEFTVAPAYYLVPGVGKARSMTSQTAQEGDVLILEVWVHSTSATYSTMTAYDGSSEYNWADDAAFIVFSPKLGNPLPPVIYVSPPDNATVVPGTDPIVWTSDVSANSSHFQLQTALDEAFTSGVQNFYSWLDNGFEYWDGSAWQTLDKASGMPAAYSGNDVRYTATSGFSGTLYSQIRQTAETA